MENINIIDFESGFIKNFNVLQERHLSDLKDYFYYQEDVEKILIKEDPLIYKVYETKYELPGSLSYAVTEIEPGKVGPEYYFTKGHFHSKSAAEIYIIFQGEGILLLQNRSGDKKTYNMFRGAIINVEPDFAHRSINTGKEKLIFLAIYQSDAGHDYESIKEKGFSFLVIDRNGPTLIKNPKY
ncbi:MAG: glucose-6-phosphate isomerase family protein [Thermoplasmata archaeon]|nr:glucose-6-phosphate isomerase family protein [Thermoplasmata archaeon]